MWALKFTLERSDRDVFIFSNLHGFYLWTTDIERALKSVIPLVQHLVWKNEQQCCVAESDLNTDELLAGKTNLIFKKVDSLQSPPLYLQGDWWTYPDGTFFFLPKEREQIPARLVEKIKNDLKGRTA